MKFERNKKSKKWFLCGLICVVVLTITISLKGSKAGYRSTASIELTSGTIVSSPYDFKILSLYIDGVKQADNVQVPIKDGYVIKESESYCCKTTPCNIDNKDNNVRLYTDELGNHVFSGVSTKSKCNLSFEKNTISNPTTMSELLDKYYIYKKVKTSKNKDFNVPFIEETKNTIFVAPDGDNFSYYFAGNPQDNWVLFGGYYWRIIRVNGDGSIRMIYQGEEKYGPTTAGDKTQIGTSKFNSNYNDNAYVGYWYGTSGSTTYDETHKNTNPSTVYTYLNNWFENESGLKSEKYFNKIDLDAGFCGDRTPSSSKTEINGLGGTGTTRTYYGAYVRLGQGSAGGVTTSTTTVTPTLTCANKIDDLYTYTGAKAGQGNHKLDNPIGLITADEVAYGGLIIGALTRTNYLDTQQHYWTISPSAYPEGSVFSVHSGGGLGLPGVYNSIGIRPVINLRSDVTFTGDGTQSNPYKVVD